MSQTSVPSYAKAQLRRKHKRAKRGIFSLERPFIWLLPALFLLLSATVFPLFYNLYHSFFRFDLLRRGFVPIGWGNWAELIQDPRIHNSLWVTFKYTVIALTLELVLGMLIALLLDCEPWGLPVLSTLIILPMVVPPAVTGLMFQLIEHSEFGILSWVLYGLGLLHPSEPLLGGTGKHALTGVLIADIWQWTPFMVLILLAGLKALPSEPLEAAVVDGANPWQRFWFIIIPLLRPVIAVAVLVRLIDLYRVFDYIYIMTAGGPGRATEVLSYYTYTQAFGFTKWGYAATMGVFILILINIIALVGSKILKVEW